MHGCVTHWNFIKTTNTHQRLLKYIWNAIHVQINSIHSHGERSGSPYQPGSPGANDLAMRFGRVQYRTHFRAVICAKYSACFSSMRAMVVSSGVCSKASYYSFEDVRILPASRDCPIHVTPILFPAAKLLAEHAQERGTPRIPYRSIEPTLCSTGQEG